MSPRTVILGLNAYHGDAAACLVVDGQLVAAVEEERFRRIKHWAGFPSQAIRYCLEAGGVAPEEIDHVAINRDPKANAWHKLSFGLTSRPGLGAVVDRLKNARKVSSLTQTLAEALDVDPAQLKAQVHNIEHHRAHLASAFLVSPFDSSAVVSVDGFGDFSSTAWGHGQGSSFDIAQRVFFPHSLGLFYLAITQYLGFPNYGDEYKVMGLAAHGKPYEIGTLERLIKLKKNGLFELNLDYFVHHKGGVAMTWENGSPELSSAFSKKLEQLLGPARQKDEPVGERHFNLASSAQALYERAFFHLLDAVHKKTGESRLALAGGCAMNSAANGEIIERSKFEDVYIPPSPGDAGGTVKEIGVFSTHLDTLDNTHVVLPNSAIWGAKISNLTANPTRRNDMSIGVSYGDDINKAREIILETLRADDRVLAEPAPAVAFEGLGDSSIDLLVMPWCHPDHYWDLRWDMFQRIKENLEKGGCSIPFPQRDVHLFKAN